MSNAGGNPSPGSQEAQWVHWAVDSLGYRNDVRWENLKNHDKKSH